jgi:hypothetical protein
MEFWRRRVPNAGSGIKFLPELTEYDGLPNAVEENKVSERR